MKKINLYLGFTFLLVSQLAFAQDIFKQHGFTKEPLTLSNGSYNEFFNNDEVIQIGTVLLNTKTNKIVAFVAEETDTAYKAELSSRWLSIDPLARKYPQLSPYVYVANNPIIAIDVDGRDIIVVNAPTGAKGYGHMAMLVGNDKRGWTFVSKEGRNKSAWYSNEFTGGPALTPKILKFKNQEEFEKYRKSNLKEYTQDVHFTTNLDQDRAATNAAIESAGTWYQFLENNCADAVSDGLEAAGLDPGYSDGSVPLLDPRPNERFKQIQKNNEDKKSDVNNNSNSNSGKDAFAIISQWLRENPNITITVK